MMNQDSSRSHSIFTITIEATERFNAADAGETHGCMPCWPCHRLLNAHAWVAMPGWQITPAPILHGCTHCAVWLCLVSCAAHLAAAATTSHIRVGKLNLVDLAGSERQSKTGATGSPGLGRCRLP